MIEDYNYGFIDYKYYGEYSKDPLYILMINEQYETLRKSFYDLEDDIKNILDYFVIQRNKLENIDLNIDKYICKLKNLYLDNYNKS